MRRTLKPISVAAEKIHKPGNSIPLMTKRQIRRVDVDWTVNKLAVV